MSEVGIWVSTIILNVLSNAISTFAGLHERDDLRKLVKRLGPITEVSLAQWVEELGLESARVQDVLGRLQAFFQSHAFMAATWTVAAEVLQPGGPNRVGTAQLHTHMQSLFPEDHAFAATVAERVHSELVELIGRLAAAESRLVGPKVREAAFAKTTQEYLDSIVSLLEAQKNDPLLAFARMESLANSYRHLVHHSTKDVLVPHPMMTRWVPIEKIYVGSTIPAHAIPDTRDHETVVRLLRSELRTVVLGDPGAGKSTLVQWLAHQVSEATDYSGELTPFVIPLKEFNQAHAEGVSFVEFIASSLKKRYQFAEPLPQLVGMVEFLLVNGLALVCFDAIDELMDPGLRVEIVGRIETFAEKYPAAVILATARILGYDYAPLTVFTVGVIDDFDVDQVAAYVHRWFSATDEEPKERYDDEVQQFMQESLLADDLRRNPLLLALICSIYRGYGYIPRNRPAVYEACATLLYQKWEQRPGLKRDLKIEHHLLWLIADLASWIYEDPALQAGASESAIVERAAAFLERERFPDPREARTVAKDFIAYCRDRLWVLSEVSEIAGEAQYGFTHRTFLEYFASRDLVYRFEDTEELALAIIGIAARNDASMVPELAVQEAFRTRKAASRILEIAVRSVYDAHPAISLAVLRLCTASLQFVVPPPTVTAEIVEALIGLVVHKPRASSGHGPLFEGANADTYVSTLLYEDIRHYDDYDRKPDEDNDEDDGPLRIADVEPLELLAHRLLDSTIENCDGVASGLETTLTRYLTGDDTQAAAAALLASLSAGHVRAPLGDLLISRVVGRAYERSQVTEFWVQWFENYLRDPRVVSAVTQAGTQDFPIAVWLATLGLLSPAEFRQHHGVVRAFWRPLPLGQWTPFALSATALGVFAADQGEFFEWAHRVLDELAQGIAQPRRGGLIETEFSRKAATASRARLYIEDDLAACLEVAGLLHGHVARGNLHESVLPSAAMVLAVFWEHGVHASARSLPREATPYLPREFHPIFDLFKFREEPLEDPAVMDRLFDQVGFTEPQALLIEAWLNGRNLL